MFKHFMKDEFKKAASNEVKPKRIYPHTGDVLMDKDGGFYVVLCLSKHTETHQPLVTYREINGDDENQTRPLEMFTEDHFKIMFNVSSLKGMFE